TFFINTQLVSSLLKGIKKTLVTKCNKGFLFR
ncbi:MAG: hypothetical protein ACI9HU_001782, partial [Colwellia sp.]